MLLLKTDFKLLFGVAIPLFTWLVLLIIVFWKILKFYTLGKWSKQNPNPHEKETLALPRGVIRGVLTLTILVAVILFQIYAINNLETMDKLSSLIHAFELMLAFYFGSKVMHHLASVDKNKTKALAAAQNPENNDFDDPGAEG